MNTEDHHTEDRVPFVRVQSTVIRALPAGFSPVRVSVGGSDRTFLVRFHDMPAGAGDESRWSVQVSADAATATSIEMRNWQGPLPPPA